MTRNEAIYCMKSYLPDDSYEHCIKCKYYEENGCRSSEAHSLAIRALQEQLDREIKVGDEVIYHGYDRGVVTATTKDTITMLSRSGDWTVKADPQEFAKTGQHFPQIVDILKQMAEADK